MRHPLAWFTAASCALVLNACYDADVGGGGGDDDGGSSGFGGSIGGSSGKGGSSGSGGSIGGSSGKGGSSGFGGSTGGNISTGGTGGVSGFGGTGGSLGGSAGLGGSSATGGTGGVVPDASCAAAESMLNQCGLLEGELPECDDTLQADRCASGCTVAATCTELTDFFCSSVMNPFYSCVAGCAGVSPAAPPSGSFYCNDGQQIPADYQCDSIPDCPEGEDELDCDTYTCLDGYVIPTSAVCDGAIHCSSGEDEAACEGTYTCLDGFVIPVSAVCDGYLHCTGGDDEADCGGGTFPICGGVGQ